MPGKFILKLVLRIQEQDVGNEDDTGEREEPDADCGCHCDLSVDFTKAFSLVESFRISAWTTIGARN